MEPIRAIPASLVRNGSLHFLTSEKPAKEVQTNEQGCGFEAFLQAERPTERHFCVVGLDLMGLDVGSHLQTAQAPEGVM